MARGLIYVKRGGRFLAGTELQSAVERVAGPHIRRGVMAVQAGVQTETPVLTGTLRRGWFVTELVWEGLLLLARLANRVVYARRVNRTSVNNAGYIERGVTRTKEQGQQIIMAGLGEIKNFIWGSR